MGSAATRYASTTEFVNRVLRGETLTVSEEAVVTSLLDTVSRRVDRYCRRTFHPSAAATIRYFTALRSGTLVIDDLTTLTTLASDEDGDRTYERTWSATDYDLEPFNASEIYRPYTSISVTPTGNYSFPAGVPKGVKITGVWGWPSIPEEVKEATIIETAGLWQQGKGIGGIVGGGAMGVGIQDTIMHPMAVTLLGHLRRVMVGVAV